MQGLKIRPCVVALGIFLTASAGGVLVTQDGDKKREILKDIDPGDGWIYDNYQAGVTLAKKQGKPIFVVFR